MTAPEFGLLQRVCGHDVPALSSQTLKLALEVAGEGNDDAEFLAETLEEDPRLARRSLILANFFLGPDEPANRLRAALALLGAHASREHLWMLAISETLQGHAGAQTPAREHLWRHSLLTGLLADRLSAHWGFENSGPLLTAGMAHDVGHLILHHPAAESSPDRFEEYGAPVPGDGPPEQDHSVLGSHLLRWWHAPPAVVETALHHHGPHAAGIEFQPSVALVQIADLLAEYVDAPQQPVMLPVLDSATSRIINEHCGLSTLPDVHHLAAELLPQVVYDAERLQALLES